MCMVTNKKMKSFSISLASPWHILLSVIKKIEEKKVRKKLINRNKTRVHGHKIKMESLSIPLASPWHILLSAMQKEEMKKRETKTEKRGLT